MRDWLKKLRGEKPIKEIATAAGISESYYSMIESGQRRPSVDVAQGIGAILNFDWQLFFPNKNNPAPELDTA